MNQSLSKIGEKDVIHLAKMVSTPALTGTKKCELFVPFEIPVFGSSLPPFRQEISTIPGWRKLRGRI
jgi:hypothetical protein